MLEDETARAAESCGEENEVIELAYRRPRHPCCVAGVTLTVQGFRAKWKLIDTVGTCRIKPVASV